MNHPWNVIAYGLRVQISRTQVSIEWTMERDYARAESSNWCQISIDWISKLWTAWRTSWEFKVDIIRSELPLQARNSTHSWSQVNILYQFPFVIGNRRIFRHMNTGQFDLDLPLAGSTETSWAEPSQLNGSPTNSPTIFYHLPSGYSNNHKMGIDIFCPPRNGLAVSL